MFKKYAKKSSKNQQNGIQELCRKMLKKNAGNNMRIMKDNKIF